MIGKRIDDLWNEVKALGIEKNVQGKPLKNGEIKVGKKELIEALRAYHIGAKAAIDNNLKRFLGYEAVMTCFRYPELSEKEKDELWKSTDWGFEEKYDGVRIVICFNDDSGFSFFSRHLSVQDYLPVDYTENILTTVNPSIVGKSYRSFILDAELISTNPHLPTQISKEFQVLTETQLQAVTSLLNLLPEKAIQVQKGGSPLKFHIFDVLEVDGQDVQGSTLLARKRILARIVETLQKAGLNCENTRIFFNPSNKYPLFEKIVERGGEGVVAKHKDSLYIATTSRRRDGWVKIKRSVSHQFAEMGLGDTIDGWICGGIKGTKGKQFEGKIVGFDVAAFVRDKNGEMEERVIAAVVNIPEELMADVSTPEGELNPAYLDRVIVVDGQVFGCRSRRIKHAFFVRFRDDKTKYDCIIDESFIEANIL